MVYAYLIEDVRALADLFKVNLAPKPSSNGLFTAYRVRHPDFVARQALVLLGISSKALKQPLPESVGKEVHVSVEEGDLFLYQEEAEGKNKKIQLEVFGFDSAPHLEELIEPIPRARDEADVHDSSVVFWLDDPSLMPEIVRRSLYLNNDRIQLATFRAPGTASAEDGREVMLVRIEAPSYYLLTWCQEQDPARQRLFVPMTESPGLYVQWGYRHPLSELWRRAFVEHQDRWMFFPAGEHFQVIDRPEWKNIYELTDFEVDVEALESWEQVRHEEAERFHVTLRLAPRHEPAPVEMLLLREDDRERLEDYFTLSDDEDIERLELSAVKDDEGQKWFFLRERHRGSDGTLLMQVGGISFARYKGFDNLFLPADLVLEPQLRRDQYKRLFDLEPAVLSFIVPDYERALGRAGTREESLQNAKHIRVLRGSFEPLKNFVDHIAHFERQALEEILQDSIFDLGIYKDAPSRAGMKRSLNKVSGPKQSLPRERKKEEGDDDGRMKKRLERARRRARRIELQAKPEELEKLETTPEVNLPTELELIEADLERDLIRQGPQVELWQDLLSVKLQRQQWQDALTSAIEGLWTTLYPLDGVRLAPPGEEVIEAMKRGMNEAFEAAHREPRELAPVIKLFAQPHGAGSDMALAELMTSANELRAVEDKLSKKVRWLAWRTILETTQDVRTQEEVRESILKELNKNGLLTQDAAPFLRERILKDPDLELDDEEFEDGADTNYVVQNIDVIEQAIEHLQTRKIQHASRASLARILSNMGMNARARDLIEAALQGMDDMLVEQGARESKKSWAEHVMDFFRSNKSGSRGSQARPERWHVWVALNAWLVFRRIEPSRAEEAQRAYDFLFEQLQEFEKDDMRRTAESLEARVGQQNVAEFLAIDSRSFFSSRPLPTNMQKVVQGLERVHETNQAASAKNSENVAELVSRGVELAMNEMTASAHPSLETVARLILEMVDSLRRLKWDKEQRPVEIFEAFVDDLPTRPLTPEASRLYFAVLHCAAARALMDLGREKKAMARLADIIDWVGQDYMQVLDFVDLVKKEVLLAIELAPRNQRVEALRHLMSSLVAQEQHEIGNDPKHPGAGFEMPYQAYELIQMIDHTLEAAISNEKLVLRRLRDFEEREEARIRYWVQRDQPASVE